MDRRRSLKALAGVAVAAGMTLAALPAWARCENHKPGPKPQNTARGYVGQTMDDIIDRGFMTIAVYDDFPPYSYQENGTPMGIDIDVGHILADALGVEARFTFVQAGENLQSDLMNYVWKGTIQNEPVSNVMLRVPYNSDFACQVEQVQFSGQYAKEEIAIAYSKAAYPDAVQGDQDRHPDAPVPAFFRYDTVAVENDSISDFYLTSFPGGNMGANIHRFPTMAEAVGAVNSGEVMAAMGPRAQLQFSAGPGVAVHKPPLVNFALSAWTVGLAVHTSHRDLAYALDDAIAAALADGRMAAIYQSRGLVFSPPDR